MSPNERTQPPPPGSGPTVEHEQTIEGRAPQPKPTRRAAVGWSAWFGLPRALAFSLPVEPRQPVRAILCKVRRTSAASAPRARVPCPGTPPAPANERYSAKPNRAAHIATTHMQALRRTPKLSHRRPAEVPPSNTSKPSKAEHRNRNPPGGRRLAVVPGSAVRSSCDGLVLGTAEHPRIPLTHRCHTSQSVPTPHCALAAYSQRSSSVAAAHARSEVRARGCPDRRCPPNAHRLRTQNARTDRRGRPVASALETDAARPRSVQ